MKTFLLVVDSISMWSGKVFAWLLLPATLVIVYGVIRRYAFNAPTVIEQDLTTYLCMSTYLLGGAYAQLRNAHVRVDVIYMQFSPRLKAIMELVGIPVFFIGLAVLMWSGIDWTILAIAKHQTAGTEWNPPIWPMRSLIILGSFFLLIQGVATVIRSIGLITGKQAPWMTPLEGGGNEY